MFRENEEKRKFWNMVMFTRSFSPLTKHMRTQQNTHSTCEVCGYEDPLTLQRHHMIPLAWGGPDVPENLITLCANCHAKVTKAMATITKGKAMRRILDMKLANGINILELYEAASLDLTIVETIREKISNANLSPIVKKRPKVPFSEE